MEQNRKIWHTAPFRVMQDGEEHILFWVIHRSGLDPDKSFVFEYDLYKKGSQSKPVANHMPHAEAVRRIAEIERKAEGKYPRADEEEAFEHPSVNWQRPDMAPWQQHPLYQEGLKNEVFQRLRAKRPPGFGPK